MKRLALFVLFFACAALVGNMAFAEAGSLYQQEGGDNDKDTVEVDAAGEGPHETEAENSYTNWIHQEGNWEWTGVYAGSEGWLTENETGDPELKVEADVEMYCSQGLNGHRVYFHLGNIIEAEENDLTANISGHLASNNGQYVGLSFNGQDKTDADFEKENDTTYTGVIKDGMQSDHDTWRDQDEAMDIEFLLSWDGGDSYEAPVNFGEGAHDTIDNTLWWLVNDGEPGSYDLDYRVRLLPEESQPDGDYYLDPVVVTAPAL